MYSWGLFVTKARMIAMDRRRGKGLLGTLVTLCSTRNWGLPNMASKWGEPLYGVLWLPSVVILPSHKIPVSEKPPLYYGTTGRWLVCVFTRPALPSPAAALPAQLKPLLTQYKPYQALPCTFTSYTKASTCRDKDLLALSVIVPCNYVGSILMRPPFDQSGRRLHAVL